MEGFLLNGVERLLISASSPREAFLASPEKCKPFLRQLNKPKSRSQSPTKRVRPTEQQELDSGLKRLRLDSGISSSASNLSHSSPDTHIPTALDVELTALERVARESTKRASQIGPWWYLGGGARLDASTTRKQVHVAGILEKVLSCER